MEVRRIGEAHLPTCAAEGADQRMPVRWFGALDPDRTFLAVQVTAKIGVVLQLAIEWQNLFKTPLFVASRHPLVEVSGYPADSDRGVDGRTATSNFPSVKRNLPLRSRLRDPI